MPGPIKQYADWNTGVLHPKINSQQHIRIFCSTIVKVGKQWIKVLLDLTFVIYGQKIKFQDQCCKDSRHTRNKKLFYFPPK